MRSERQYQIWRLETSRERTEKRFSGLYFPFVALKTYQGNRIHIWHMGEVVSGQLTTIVPRNPSLREDETDDYWSSLKGVEYFSTQGQVKALLKSSLENSPTSTALLSNRETFWPTIGISLIQWLSRENVDPHVLPVKLIPSTSIGEWDSSRGKWHYRKGKSILE